MRTKITLLATVLPILVFGHVGVYAQSNGESVPDTISDSRWPAAWVATSAAVAMDGTLRESVLRGHTALLRRTAAQNGKEAADARTKAAAANLSANGDGCYAYLSRLSESFTPVESFEDLLANSVTIVRGRVIAVSQGLYHGMPGSLIRLSATYLRGKRFSETYLFYPLAAIRTADGMLCAKPRGQFTPPAVGDEMLFFDIVPDPVDFDGRVMFSVDVSKQLIHQSVGAKEAVAPAAFDRIQPGPKGLIESVASRVVRKQRPVKGATR